MTTSPPSIIGQSLPRIDAREKVTGGASFTVDMRLPGMLWGKALRSSHAHARILRVDASRALELPGVKAVLTPADVPAVPFVLVPPPHGVGDQYILNDQARFVGEAVAAVAANTKEIAEEALDLIEVEYEELPALFDPEEALREGAPWIHAGGNLVGSPLIEQSGDLEEAFREADRVFEDRYVTSRQCHCALETHACLVHYDAGGKLTLWSSTQTPFGLQEMLSRTLGLPPSRIRVIAPYVGGAFGGKFSPAMEGLAALLSIKAGRPVRMECDRQEELVATRTRHRFIVTLRTGVKRDGTLLAREARVLMDSGAYADLGLEVMKWAKMCFEALYRARAVRYEGRLAYTNSPVGGAYRGFGNPQITFAVESQMEAIAQALGIDPLELRLKNLLRAGESSPLEKWTLTSSGLSQCLELGAERIGWRVSRAKRSPESLANGFSGPKEAAEKEIFRVEGESPGSHVHPSTRLRTGLAPQDPRPASSGPPSMAHSSSRFRRGLGLACMVHGSGARTLFGAPDLSACFLKLNDDGTIHLLTGSVEIGQGNKTALAQIVAEELGVPLEDVAVTCSDTEVTPYDFGSGASRITYVAGNAARSAAAELKERLLQRAAEMLDADARYLEIRERQVYLKGRPEKGTPLRQVISYAQFAPPATKFMASVTYEPPQTLPVFAAQLAEVEVDTDTGQVRVLRLVAAHDVGRAINPAIAQAQIEGALHHGIGYALTEGLMLDPEGGQPLNSSFADYKLLTALDMPPIEALLVESIDPVGPFGAKGVGEPAMVAAAPAIANAIYNAVGVRIQELPITPEKVLKALRAEISQ